ncbi:hypothetical protein FOZ76_22195 [Verticiella sediminum]|uniref:Uncharacterized protein n=1 Tax=Verticiella sediminum TaxID=1247510 RepID=A0A556ACC3_9BURK|nr:hypothetical protein [Verticiella sediminum]TSH90523.1 hypothetical protein FOZ76_22195 [Verticiella sediminum]
MLPIWNAANWIGAGTLVVALAYAFLRWLRDDDKASFALHASHGVAVVPFCLLCLVALWDGLAAALLGQSRVLVSLAGLYALILLAQRVLQPLPRRRKPHPARAAAAGTRPNAAPTDDINDERRTT